MGEENCIHWEHGSVWHPGRERERELYLRRIPVAIVNSNASARVMQLVWGYPGEIRICLNALRPSLTPPEPLHKKYPSKRAIRLGVAARLMPVKGVALVLHAAALLKKQSLDVELHIAGAGVELERLRSLAGALNIASQTRFHGAVRDMGRFYRSIDCLVHPPLTEAFGLVAIEAGGHGCPAIVAAVDGLPEAVEEGVSGHCISPTLSLAEYAELAGAAGGIPEYVYDPAADEMREPKAVDPVALAAAVRRLFFDVESYERISRSASEHVLAKCQFDRHVDQVMGVINGFLAR
jgi:glycosyltransferase involved in cell wall biosynthesis